MDYEKGPLEVLVSMAEDAKPIFNLEPFRFDTNFCEILSSESGGGLAVFRLIDDENKELFLSIYNYHNGYHSHGFEFSVKGTVVREDSL